MELKVDIQTLQDLRIFDTGDGGGIFDLYNRCVTRGGERLLRDMFQHPLSDLERIGERRQYFSFFMDKPHQFPLDPHMLDVVERYIQDPPLAGRNGVQQLSEKDLQQAVRATIYLFKTVRDYLHRDNIYQSFALSRRVRELFTWLDDSIFAPVYRDDSTAKLSFSAATAYDRLFRLQTNQQIRILLKFVYELDVWISVAEVSRCYGWALPEVHSKGSKKLEIEGLYHPELRQAVKNNVSMNQPTTMLFLTGANMAGKSTFLRAFGTAIYLAHMGFPVAASKMSISLMDAIFTTINLPDNIGIGASHFYAEVLRVKQLAEWLQKGLHVFVIFDELFRGTNVKDAHEATVAVSKGFVKSLDSRFVISSHIVEAASDLAHLDSVSFVYLPTVMVGLMPRYTYQLSEGVTDDRHGMMIIRNEGILEVLANGNKLN